LGKSDGNFYWYHPDSTLKMTTMFVNGNKEGTYLSYYPNKNPQCICSYHDDKRNGLQIIHWETGKVFMKAQYSEGKLINIYEYNNKEGKLRDFGTLKDGNGTFIHYKDDESIEYVEEYQNGVMIKTSQNKSKSKSKTK
jgi:antitoxin component YwqK of YwqJK toxin-antitoxin module